MPTDLQCRVYERDICLFYVSSCLLYVFIFTVTVRLLAVSYCNVQCGICIFKVVVAIIVARACII